MRNWRSCFCANGSALSMAKRKVIGEKGRASLEMDRGATCSPTFAERETLKKRNVHSMFLLLLGYHKCIATPISHA